jgi:cell division protein FtsZ
VAHPDANIIFGTVIDDDMGDEVRVTVIAAGFDRWDDGKGRNIGGGGPTRASAVFGDDDADDDLDLDGDDDFDVPSFLK